MITESDYPAPWPLWQKVFFRFFFIYLLLQVFQRPFFESVPVFKLIARAQRYICYVSVNFFNTHVLHFRDRLDPAAKSTDSLFDWAQLLLSLIITVAGTIVWSFLDRNRKSYYRASFYLMLVLRYFIAYISITYGIVKLYAIQMPTPTLSDIATPMGDFSPMKFSWQFVGYSTAYQIFSGVMELTVAILILYRRTVTLALFIGLGVYINVLMMNLCFDIHIKLLSAHLVLMCLFLLINDIKRLADFFIFNKPATQNTLYHFAPQKKGKTARLVLKCIFFLSSLYMLAGPFNYHNRYFASLKQEIKPIPYGLYDVTTFVKNGDTLPVLANDTLIWKDMIFERGNRYATVNSADTVFKKIYNRGFFFYKADTINNTMACFKQTKKGKVPVFKLRYKLSDNKKHVQMWIGLKRDSIYLELDKSNRKFELSDRPFHWISEVNR